MPAFGLVAGHRFELFFSPSTDIYRRGVYYQTILKRVAYYHHLPAMWMCARSETSSPL